MREPQCYIGGSRILSKTLRGRSAFAALGIWGLSPEVRKDSVEVARIATPLKQGVNASATPATPENPRSPGLCPRFLGHWGLVILWSLAIGHRSFLQAGLPEPDNLVYGTIVLNGTPVTSDNPSVVVEARSSGGTNVLASHRMGTKPEAGKYFYVLRLALESVPKQCATAASLGDTILITVFDETGPRGQQTFQLTEWGAVTRLDFGPPVEDTDENGLPDDWEQTTLGSVGQNANQDTDGDGQSNFAEFIAGTDPANTNSVFSLAVAKNHEAAWVSFVARRAEGPCYATK
jgi:hypothetical protein